jgi:oligopeptide/dipeptide ABC transporter ATP-binding protein
MSGVRPILEVRNLTVSFRSDAGRLRAVDGVDFDVAPGRTLALVGESGCGKTVTALSVMRLLDASAGSIDGGEILFGGEDLLALSPAQMRRVRGDRISMIFQEPMTAMNPVLTVGAQIGEVFRIHRGATRAAAREAAVGALRGVGIPDPGVRVDEYPFQFSGGMLQRAMIAMAVACEPALLIADEPTTALDVTIQAQILDLLLDLQRSHGTSILLITHDLGVVAEVADDVAVMYGGRIVERGPAAQLLAEPQHPYTAGLLAAMPGIDADKAQPLTTVPGSVPRIGDMPTGCRFHPRCAHVQDLCRLEIPPLEGRGERRSVACHWVAGRLPG